MGKSKKSESGGQGAAAGPSESDPSLSFESALDQLETAVARLEEGEMPLEEALDLFENGVKLARQCATTLEAAEKRIEILVADREDATNWRAEAFEADESDDDGEESD